MIDRYTTEEMSSVWSDDFKFNCWIKIEYLATLGWENLGTIVPVGVSKALSSLDATSLNRQRLKEIEKQVKHEFLAFLTHINELTPKEDNRFYHRGLTSSDVLDTAFSFQLKTAGEIILKELKLFIETLKSQALKYKHTPMIGRSHGMYGEPITFGLVLATHYSEWQRHAIRLERAIEEVSYGKISGPMGNYTIVDPSVEEFVCKELGLKVEPISTQVIPRDRYATFFMVMGLMGSSIERLALEVRNLQQSSVGEVGEEFTEGQKGSSAMPHKKNPISSENLCGVARLLRSYINPSLEDIPLWYERDMSHSSVERVIAPDASHLAHYGIRRLNSVIGGLEVNRKKMLEHVEEAHYWTQMAMIKDTDMGFSREEAYERARGSVSTDLSLEEILRNTEVIFNRLGLK